MPVEIPAGLTAPVAEPDASDVKTNGEMLELLLDYQLTLRVCNGKLTSLGNAYGKR